MKAAKFPVLGTLLLIAGLFVTSAAAANTGFGPLIIQQVGTYGSGGIFIVLSGNINAPSCSIPNRIDIPASNPQVKQIYALALAAMAAGQPVSGAVNGCDPNTNDATIDTTYNSWIYAQ